MTSTQRMTHRLDDELLRPKPTARDKRIAELLGIRPAHVAQYRAGQRWPAAWVRRAIAEAEKAHR